MQVMKTVNDLIRVPELNQTMQSMSREMMKAGLIEETMGEMMDDMFDTDEIEEDADAEVDKVGVDCLDRHHHANLQHMHQSFWLVVDIISSTHCSLLMFITHHACAA